MRTQISIHDFYFLQTGYGHYKVTYTSPVTGKEWSIITTNTPLIDATKNVDYPKIKNLIELKKVCKA
jgi:hypothetical protein